MNFKKTLKNNENNFIRKLLFSVFILFGISMSFAQQKITGAIKDSDGILVAGASVSEKGTTNGVVSDFNGNYEITTKNSNPILVFSYIGYKTQEILVGNKKVINVTLENDLEQLSEIVVIGYGTQKREEVTSAIATVKSEDFTAGAVRNASELIRGKVAGLVISNGSGDPTSGSSVSLRGISTLKGGTSPLVLINGIPGGFDSVAPDDIASIDVLKDASAAAIYGTRGANGVILITTKTINKDTPTTLTYSNYVAFSSLGKKADFIDADDARRLMSEGFTLPYEDLGYNTDWLGEISRTAFTENHNIGLKGGSAKSNYVANISYIDQEGVFLGSNNKEFRVSLDLNHYMFDDKLKFNVNLVNGIQNIDASFSTYAYRQALIRNPTDRVKDDEGNWTEEVSRFQYQNPVSMIEETTNDIENKWLRLTGNLTLSLLDGWDTKLSASTLRNSSFTGYSETKNHISTIRDGRKGYASRSTNESKTDIFELTTSYKTSIDKNKISGIIGYSYQYNVNEGFSAANSNFPTDAYSYNNLGAGQGIDNSGAGGAGVSSYKNDNTLIGFFGRASYSYDNKYFLLASLRREGSSKFGNNYKWGSFPSVSLGWTVSNESFLENVSYINNLKLRIGYGETGVIPNNSYQSLTRFSYGDWFYNNGEWIQGLVPASNPNPDLRWETTTEYNIGLDFAFLNHRISGSIDIYNKQTKDMLWDYQVPTPPYLYSTILANVGEMENKGIEILLNTTPIQNKNFTWDSSVTLSHNKNKLLSLSNDLYEIDGDFIDVGGVGDPISMSTHRLEVGQSVGNIWGLKSVDITDDGLWIIETSDGTRKTLEPNIATDENKQYLGNGIPAYNVGWTNTFSYKNFDLSIVLTGALDFQIINQQRMFYENPNINYNMLNSAFDNVYDKTKLNYAQTFVSDYIEDGDYLKLDNVTFAYNFDLKKLNFINSAKLYVSGTNLATITGYSGLDPEVASGLIGAGNDNRDKYPTTRTFTLGLNLTF